MGLRTRGAGRPHLSALGLGSLRGRGRPDALCLRGAAQDSCSVGVQGMMRANAGLVLSMASSACLPKL